MKKILFAVLTMAVLSIGGAPGLSTKAQAVVSSGCKAQVTVGNYCSCVKGNVYKDCTVFYQRINSFCTSYGMCGFTY